MVFKEEPPATMYFKEECEPVEEEEEDEEEVKDDRPNSVIKCQTCNSRFCSDSEYNSHVYNDSLGLFVCCKCSSKFVDEKTIRQHMRDHTLQTNSNNVVLLPNKAKQITDLAKSGKLIDSRINDKFICKYCEKDFIQRSDFYDHYMSHMGKIKVKKTNERTYDTVSFNGCRVQDYFRVEQLYFELKHVCKLCGQGFNTTNKEIEHRKYCKQKRNWICDVCKCEFQNFNDLFLHFDIAHRHINRICRFCHSFYANEKRLIKHILEQHLDYTFYCFFCSEGFYTCRLYNAHCQLH